MGAALTAGADGALVAGHPARAGEPGGAARGAGGAAFARTGLRSRGWAAAAQSHRARATPGQLHPASGGAGVRDRPAGRGDQPGDRAGAALAPDPVWPLSSPGQNICAPDPGAAAAGSLALAPREPVPGASRGGGVRARAAGNVRGQDTAAQGYGPANLVALLRLLRGDLRGLDLSHLALRGAYLQGVEMQDST